MTFLPPHDFTIWSKAPKNRLLPALVLGGLGLFLLTISGLITWWGTAAVVLVAYSVHRAVKNHQVVQPGESWWQLSYNIVWAIPPGRYWWNPIFRLEDGSTFTVRFRDGTNVVFTIFFPSGLDVYSVQKFLVWYQQIPDNRKNFLNLLFHLGEAAKRDDPFTVNFTISR